MEQRGHSSLPFGCMDGNERLRTYSSLIDADEPHGVHGIGLPNFINNPGPPGQPLLSEQENAGLDNFFSGFDEGQSQHHPQLPGQFHDNMSQLQPLQMPQTYVGHETYVRSPMEWHSQHIPSYQFGASINGMAPMQTPTSPHTNGHVISPVNGYPMTHNNMSGFSSNWQAPYSNHHGFGHRPSMEFGSDQNFAAHGYAAPEGSMEPDVTSVIQYAMAPASSTNTQPNSRANSNPNSNPNTEPSSPVAQKKRRLNAFGSESLRMTSMPGQGSVATKASPPAPAARKNSRKMSTKHDQLPTPLSKTPTDEADDQDDDDAEYDEDAVAASPRAPWPSNKQRPEHKPDMPKPAKPSRRRSQAAADKPKPPRRASSSTTNISRVPLTAEQKKQNHTNSEQRRRDATARSYAELYDRVPELNELGKQSTMKKLEVVVAKVRKMKDRLAYLESLTAGNANSAVLSNHQVAQYPEMAQIPAWQ